MARMRRSRAMGCWMGRWCLRYPWLVAALLLGLGGVGVWMTEAQELRSVPPPAGVSLVRFDGTITLGQALQFAALVGAGLTFWGRFKVMETRVNDLWRWYGRQVRDIEGQGTD